MMAGSKSHSLGLNAKTMIEIRQNYSEHKVHPVRPSNHNDKTMDMPLLQPEQFAKEEEKDLHHEYTSDLDERSIGREGQGHPRGSEVIAATSDLDGVEVLHEYRDDLSDGDSNETLERDNTISFDNTDSVTRDDFTNEEQTTSSFDESIEKKQNYLDQLIRTFPIGNVFLNFQGNTQMAIEMMRKELDDDDDDDDDEDYHDDDDDSQSSSSYSLQRSVISGRGDESLEWMSQQESRRTKKLEKRLADMEAQYQSTIIGQQNQILLLESKLAVQERMFESQLDAEKEKVTRFEMSEINEANDSNNWSQALIETIDALRAEVSELKRTKFQLTTALKEKEIKLSVALKEKDAELSAAFKETDAELQRRGESSDVKMRALAEKLVHTEKMLKDERLKSKSLESKLQDTQERLDVETNRSIEAERKVASGLETSRRLNIHLTKCEAMLDLEQKRNKELGLSLMRVELLLSREKKRVQSITEVNEHLKKVIRRTSKDRNRGKRENETHTCEDLETIESLVRKRENKLRLIKSMIQKEGRVQELGDKKSALIQAQSM